MKKKRISTGKKALSQKTRLEVVFGKGLEPLAAMLNLAAHYDRKNYLRPRAGTDARYKETREANNEAVQMAKELRAVNQEMTIAEVDRVVVAELKRKDFKPPKSVRRHIAPLWPDEARKPGRRSGKKNKRCVQRT